MVGAGILILKLLEAVDVGDVQELFHTISEEGLAVIHCADVWAESLADLQLGPSGP